jgi:hypothetical protein
MAQIGNFTQRGKATQELKTDGLSIAHPSLPLNSKATLTNTKTGKSIEVTVASRVPASSSRIADLSSGAWQELGLDSDNEITISTTPPPRPRVAAPAPPPEETAVAQETPPPETSPVTPPPEPPVETPPQLAQNSSGDGRNPIYVKVEVTLPEKQRNPPRHVSAGPSVAASYAPPQQSPQQYVPDTDLQRRLTAVAAYQPQPSYATPPPAPVPVAPPPEPVKPPVVPPQEPAKPMVVVPSYNLNLTVVPIYQTEVTTVQQAAPPPTPIRPLPAPAYQPPPACDPITAPVYQPSAPPPVSTVRVIPGYPDPNCGKLYTLQIGSYSTANAAGKAEIKMRNNGFNVSQELRSPYYRVVITGVQASTIYALVQRLGAAGVEEVIIRQ